MDYIKKIICIEGARTRTQGLMPYYEFGKEYSEHPGNGCGSRSSLNLESARGKENGNWGQFVANPCFLGEDKTYEGMLQAYYSLLNMVRNGVKLRKVETKEGEIIFTEDIGAFEWNNQCFEGGEEPETLYVYGAYDSKDFYSTDIESLREETKHIYHYTGSENVRGDKTKFIVLIDDYEKFNRLASYLDGTGYSEVGTGINIGSGDAHLKWARYCQVVDACIGKINIPASIYNKHVKVPKSMPCSDVEPYIEWLENYESLSADCCNARLYEDMGGKEFLDYLKSNARGKCSADLARLESLTYRVPYISMPLLLTQNTTDVGVLTNIDGVDYEGNLTDKQRPHGIGSPTGFTIDQITMRTGYTNTSGEIEVESLLNTLRSNKKYTDDKNNLLPGIFKEYGGSPSGKMFRCIKQSEEKFYNLVVKEKVESANDGRVHTLYYEFVENPSLTKNDIPQGNFYEGMPSEPSNRFSIDESQPNYQSQLQIKRTEMENNIPPRLNPISVATAKWRMESISNDVTEFINGDGIESEYLHYPESQIGSVSDKKYRTITTEAAGIRIAETEEEEHYGDRGGHGQPFMEHYYFKVKYNNSSSSPMEIPFSVGNTTNVYLVSSGPEGKGPYTYRGDFITSVDDSGGKIKVYYVVGGFFNGESDGKFINQVHPESGDVYYEEYALDEGHVDLVPLDGVDNVPVYSRYVDFEGSAKEFYSPRYNLTRTGNTATIKRLTTFDIWNKDFAYDAYLTKEDYLTAFSLPPKVDVNVTIDRGGVSAFEKHYKLAECNTMQDLVNYGNHYFFSE